MMRLFLSLLALGLTSACAASLCERKDKYLQTYCVGGDVTYHLDASCEAKVERCGPGQLAQLEGYVTCLEQKQMCSLDVMNDCAQRFPGGVNLSCG